MLTNQGGIRRSLFWYFDNELKKGVFQKLACDFYSKDEESVFFLVGLSAEGSIVREALENEYYYPGKTGKKKKTGIRHISIVDKT